MAGNNMYMPKSAVKVSSGYMPKSATLIKPEKTKKEKLLEFSRGDTLPNIFQAAGGVASLPLTAPLSIANPTAGKAVRTGVGALTRVGGEMVNQGIKQLASPVNMFTPKSPETHARAAENLQSLGEQAGVGLASEAAGEFVIGPLLNKTVESVVSPFLKGSAKIIGKAAYKITDLPVIRTIRDLAVSTTKSAVKLPSEIRIRAANTFLNLDSSKSILKTGEGKEINIGEAFLDDTKNFGWNGIDRTSVLKQVKNTMKSVGNKLEATEAKVKDVIPVSKLGTQVKKQYSSLLKTAPEVAKDYLDEISKFTEEHRLGISFLDAQDIKQTYDKISHTASGGLTKSTATNGEVMAKNDIANFLRQQLHSNKQVSELLQQWERMKLYRDSLAGVKPSVFPKNFNPSQLIMSPVQNQEFLIRQINRPEGIPFGDRFGALERSIGQAATPYIGSAVLNR